MRELSGYAYILMNNRFSYAICDMTYVRSAKTSWTFNRQDIVDMT